MVTKTKVQPLSVHKDKTSMCLKVEQNKEWLDAILSDDKNTIELTLKNCEEEQKDKYLNGYFEFTKNNLPVKNCACELDKSGKFTFSHCWLMAVAFGSGGVAESFIRHGCNVLTIDDNGRNAIHCLIYICFMRRDCEKEMLKMLQLIVKNIPSSVMNDLLLQEDQDRLRPLEYALHLGVSSVVLQIFSFVSVHTTKKQYHGTSITWWIDITEYEKSGERMYRSPLLLFAMYDRANIDDKSFKDLFFSPVTQKWMVAKYKALRVFLLLWFLSRVLFMFSCWVVDSTLSIMEEEYFRNLNDTEINYTQGICAQDKFGSVISRRAVYYIFIMYLYVHCVVQLVYDTVEHYTLFFRAELRWMGRTPRGRKNSIVHVLFYRVSQTLLYFTVIISLTLRLLRLHLDYEIPPNFDAIVTILMTFWLTWSILQFVQLLPGVGHFMVALQRLLANLLSCTAVFTMFNVVFAELFFRIVNENHIECVKQFNFRSGTYLYSTFLILIHMFDFRTIETEDRLTLYILHIVYVFMASIMLINFLIALFSSTVTWVNGHKDLILNVQSLSMFIILEHRLSYINLVNRYFRKHLSRFFVEENGKLYLLMTQPDVEVFYDF